jgi:beta-glucosidase
MIMTGSARVESLLKQMTLAEKVAMCHAKTNFTSAGVERLGVPPLTMSDGPHGVRQSLAEHGWDSARRNDDAVTWLPSGTCLAATWDTGMAGLYGSVLGAEARGRGKDVILGPGINIVRTPLCGRNFEYYGEDPCQVAEMVAPAIRGIQSQGVAACVKHYALNNQELNRSKVDVDVDERALREIYLYGFEAAVRDGGVLTVMGAYNQFRGQHCCHNDYLLNQVLKNDWGFEGAVISDWGGVWDTDEAVRNGLDIEMGGGSDYDNYHLATAFLDGLRNGTYDEALVDDKVRRILRVMDRIGLLDESTRAAGSVNTQEHQDAARRVAEEGIVLLKNEALLPLDRTQIRTLAVIGENATMTHAAGGGSCEVKALYEITPLEALQESLGNDVEILHAQGYPLNPAGMSMPDATCLGADAAGVRGWQGEYFLDRRDLRTPAMVRTDGAVDFVWESPPVGDKGASFAVRWRSVLTAPETGPYTFVLHGTDCSILGIDGANVINIWGGDNEPRTQTWDQTLEKGQSLNVEVTHFARRGTPTIRFGWLLPSQQHETRAAMQDAAELARTADAVVFFGGLNHLADKEGGDRSTITLPSAQDALIEMLVAANPNLAVVLYGGAAMAMPWVDKVKAVMLAWYPGMEGGRALANVLFGEVNPSGKLPMTFYRRLEDCGAHAEGDYLPDRCRYHEGLFVGYRYLDQHGIEPLFPFGHGLSYTQFRYSDLQLTVDAGGGGQATCTVRNMGPMAGAEVVQLYVGKRDSRLPRPPRELKGFRKVWLEAGESTEVSIPVDWRRLSYYDVETRNWVCEQGAYELYIGSSSRDIRLEGSITRA